MRSTLTDDLAEPQVPVASRDPLSHMTIHRYRVQPIHLGVAGSVDGGTLLEWIHRAAHATAARWSGRCCVAASVSNFHLDRPIRVGELVEVHACLVYTGHSSVHVLVTVYSGHPAGVKAAQSAQCPIVFVVVDDVGQPVAVPAWTPATMLELKRQHQARVRIRTRKRIEDAIAAQVYTAADTAPCTTRQILVSRADAHSDGAVHGGRVMRWIDEAANTCAADWCGVPGLTSYVAAIRFRRAVAFGDRVEVSARIVHTGPRSMHIGVRVTTIDMITGEVDAAAEGLVVVVSIDDQGRARHVRQWAPDCDDDIRLDRHARHLVELRQFFEPYPACAGFPPSLVGSVAAPERGFEELEL
jgi:acyl-CoA hydrolase